MLKSRTLYGALAVAVTVMSMLLGQHRVSQAQTLSVPSGLPSHFGIGLSAEPNDVQSSSGWMPQSGIPWDYAYTYLSAGVNTGNGWETWNANAEYPLYYAQGAASHGYIPVFSYYDLLQSNGTCGSCGESQKDLSNLNNAGLMASYFQNFTLLMKRLSAQTYDGIAGYGKTVIVHVEPDLSGYAEAAVLDNSGSCFSYCTAQGNSPANLKAAVSSSGDTDVSSFPNTYQGFNWALLHLRDLYAPNVRLAFHISTWATRQDIATSTDPSLNATTLGQEAGSFAAQSGITGVPSGTSSYDLLFNDVDDRDAGYYKYVTGDNNAFWDRLNVTFPNFQRWESYVSAASQAAGRSVIVWQIPEGNQYFDTENNTNGHYQDNRAEYFFSHIGELANSGIIGLLFGAGNAGSTVHTDAMGDGITNPPSICTSDGVSSGQICNNHTSTVSDDDGGYLRMEGQQYYANGAYALSGSGTTATPTNTPAPTATAPTSAPSGNIHFDFEDGTTQGWGVYWGSTVTASNTTAEAYSGSHSLALNVSGVDWPGIDVTSGLAGLSSGSTITYEVYSPSSNGVSVQPFACDGAWNTNIIPTSTMLNAGWNTVTWQIPSQTGLNCIGLQINNDPGWTGQLALDAVRFGTASATPTNTPVPTATRAPKATATSTPKPTATSTPKSAATQTTVAPLMIADFENTLNGFTGNSAVTSLAPSAYSPAVAHGTYAALAQYTIGSAWTEAQIYKIANLNLSAYSTLSVSVYPQQPVASGAGVKVRFMVQGSDSQWYNSAFQSVPIGTRSIVRWSMGSVPRAPIKQLYVCWQYTTSSTGAGNKLWLDAIQAS